MTPEPRPQPAALQPLIAIAALVVVIAGIKAAETLAVPLLLAAFIAIIVATPMTWLQNRGVPTPIALLVMLLILLIGGAAVALVIANTVAEFTTALPAYEARLRSLLDRLLPLLEQLGFDIDRATLTAYFDPAMGMDVVRQVMGALGNVLSSTLLISLTVFFILLEAKTLPAKLARVVARPEESLPRFRYFVSTMNRYMIIKTALSVVTGILAGLLTAAVGLDFPFLWALSAFALNFIPNIGSIIAAIFPTLLAAAQFGLAEALIIAAGYLAINFTIGNLLEPRIMGRGMGLSTLVVWTSLVFWGWLLGPVGMLLSVPLTTTLKIALESRRDTTWIAILLGPAVEADLIAEAGPDGEHNESPPGSETS